MISDQAHRVSFLHLLCRHVIDDTNRSVILPRKAEKTRSTYRQKN